MDTERRMQELIDEIEDDGLVGPWSWSDQLGHISAIVAYGILRGDAAPEYYEEIADAVLQYVKQQALYIVARPPKDS